MRSLKELGTIFLTRGHADKRTVLSPATAIRVGSVLMTEGLKPTRDEVVRKILCTSKCEQMCIPCIMTANLIVNTYGDGDGTDNKVPR